MSESLTTGRVGSARDSGKSAPAAVSSDLAGAFAATPYLDSALSAITATALLVVPGAVYTGIACPARGGSLRTRASTDILVDTLDLLQNTFRQGPCVDPREGAVTSVVDIATETRWPRFTAAAARLGVGSILSIAILSENGPLGTLNLYATTAAAFTIDDEIIAAVLAGDASAMLAAQSVATHRI